ncbi:hypothetical protein PLICRDRAFT_112010 [Plicaturopsis crispa FD-325 SS-3]|nr:hypothetical protein PLICRDRAFT_112010 [Plicaturopsis crispa FD-325 SS-3]
MLFPSPWLLLAAAAVQVSALSLKSPQVTIKSSSSAEPVTESLSATQKLAKPLTLGPTDTLKLTFQVLDKEDGKGVQPHQTFLRFFDEVTGEEGVQPVRVTPGGKAKFELNMARPPLSLPPTSANSPLKVSLLLGSYVHPPLKTELFDLVLPASHFPQPHPDEATFHPQPEIKHTFNPPQKLPPKVISAVFAGLVIAPWVPLLAVWGQIGPKTPNLFSPSILSFTTLLGAFEALLLWYWVDLKLGQVLLYGAILAVPTALAGNKALGAIGKKREGRE